MRFVLEFSTRRYNYAAKSCSCSCWQCNRARHHRLCVKTHQATPICRFSNPFARIGRPRNLFFTMADPPLCLCPAFLQGRKLLIFHPFFQIFGRAGANAVEDFVLVQPQLVFPLLSKPRSPHTALTLTPMAFSMFATLSLSWAESAHAESLNKFIPRSVLGAFQTSRNVLPKTPLPRPPFPGR